MVAMMVSTLVVGLVALKAEKLVVLKVGKLVV